MSARRPLPGAGQRAAGWTVLALLAAVCVWLGFAQSRMSPAVLVALAPPRPPVAAPVPESGRTFATAAALDDLPAATPATAVESYDPQTLSDRIDGKAELYLAARFKEMSVRAFVLPDGTRVEAAVYAQETPMDAYAVLSSQRRAKAASSPIARDAYHTENALYFTKGNLYVELTADRADAATGAALETLGKALAARLPADAGASATDSAALDARTLFPAEGLRPGSIRLAAADAMGMAGFADVFTAEYALPSGEATAFLALRPDAAKAAADAREFAAFLARNGYAAADAPGGPRDAVFLAADGSFEIIWARGRLVAGVHDAVSREAALELAGRLAARLGEAAP